MRALVTGSEGFVGQHLCRALWDRGDTVRRFDIARDLVDDIRRPHWMKLVTEFDVVYHLAAVTDALTEDTELVMHTNVVATERLMRKFKSRLVFASSSMAQYPQNLYGASKLMGETLARHYGCHVVRLCNLYGNGGHSVIDRFAAAGPGDVIEIRGDGEQLRTYAPVEDAVRQLLALGQCAGSSMPQWRALGGEDATVNQLAARWAPGRAVRRVPAHARDLPHAPQAIPPGWPNG